MTQLYELTVVPCDGITLTPDTEREWLLGRDFVVVSTTYLPFKSLRRDKRRGYKFFLTRKDVLDAEDNYGIRFDITFQTQSVREYLTDMADTCYAAQEILG